MIKSRYKNPIKFGSREYNIKAWREKTQCQTLPKDKYYYTLCNEQPDSSDSEIGQLLGSGLLKSKSQFYGIDRSQDIIRQNKLWHPEANWFCGEWDDFIKRPGFSPAIIYLDTLHVVEGRRALNILVETLIRCPRYTMVFANFMRNNPRLNIKVLDEDYLIHGLKQELGFGLKQWDTEVPVSMYDATGHTDMLTFIYYKKE